MIVIFCKAIYQHLYFPAWGFEIDRAMLGILKDSLPQPYRKVEFTMQCEELGLGMWVAKGKFFAGNLQLRTVRHVRQFSKMGIV